MAGEVWGTSTPLQVTMEHATWEWVPPAITTVMFVLAVNFVGDGIRDAVDPHALLDR